MGGISTSFVTLAMTAPYRPTAEDRADNFMDWVRRNAKAVTAAAVILVGAAGGYWIYRSSEGTKGARAEQAYLQAAQTYEAGNPALARTDLQKLVERYAGTIGGTLGAMLLAQIHLDEGKPAEAVAVLKKAVDDAPSAAEASARAMLAAAQVEQKQYAEAATGFRRAAELARFKADREAYLADAARAYRLAGNEAEARKIWEELANDPQSTRAAEARVRLGELVAKPAA